jgi:hypothetical protein
MTDAAPNKEARAINGELVATMIVIHRIASRALSAEERVGQRIQGDPHGEIEGLLVQMVTIEKLVRLALPEEARELLVLAAAKDEVHAIRAAGQGPLSSSVPYFPRTNGKTARWRCGPRSRHAKKRNQCRSWG